MYANTIEFTGNMKKSEIRQTTVSFKPLMITRGMLEIWNRTNNFSSSSYYRPIIYGLFMAFPS